MSFLFAFFCVVGILAQLLFSYWFIAAVYQLYSVAATAAAAALDAAAAAVEASAAALGQYFGQLLDFCLFRWVLIKIYIALP